MLTKSKNPYDLPTAVTFFLAGLGVGTVLAMFLSLRSNGEFPTSAYIPVENIR